MTKQTDTAAEIAADADAAAAEAAQQEQAEVDARVKVKAVAAQAEADAAAAAKPAPKVKANAKAKAAVASIDDLRAAIATVEAGNHAFGRDVLLTEMSDAGAQFADKDNAIHIDWMGVKMQTTAGIANALTVWCSKARRTILNGAAE